MESLGVTTKKLCSLSKTLRQAFIAAKAAGMTAVAIGDPDNDFANYDFCLSKLFRQ